MAEPRLTNALKFRQLQFEIIFLLFVSDLVFGKIHYSIREETESGAFVGNVAEDLGLNVRRLTARNFRITTADKRQCLEVNLETGILFAKERIDREQLCGQMPVCLLSFEIVVEEPLEMYRGEVEILDRNDNSPSFPESAILLQMAENILPGSSFPLESALDPDVGTNTVTGYNISPNENFGLKVETEQDGSKIIELLLEKSLDRERQSSFQLMLTASDGGSPPRSGSARILITVLDSNDNAPAFDSKVYKVNLVENSPRGTLVVSVHATDTDEGLNAEVTYCYSNRVSQKMQELFSLDPRTGEIRVQGKIDYEEASSYSLDVQAVDNGSPAITGHTKIVINVIDANDNAPEILLKSSSHLVPEDAAPGTVTALINVIDRDSGNNGEVHCEIPKNVPFKLQTFSSGHYKLLTSDMLDRETTPLYNIAILARDSGSPPLSTNKTIQITVSDINDNTPRFPRSMDTVYVVENNARGASIFAVTAYDPDLDQNSYITYSFTETRIRDLPLSNYLTLSSMNGTIYALRSFDYERVKNFQIQVQARDAGVPPLSSSATMNVIILDQNDNAPVIVSPSTQSGSAAVDIVPQSAAQGYLVTKIIATDADSGQNARLHYQVLKATDPSLFSVGLNSGEIRTARGILEQDAITQSLVILVKDNGQPSLSSTATINFSILGNVTEIYPESRNLVTNPEYDSDINLYLIVILGSTSFIFLVTIILLIGIKCKQDRNIIEDYNSPSFCNRLDDSHSDFHPRPTLKESLNYPAAGDIIRLPETHHYAVCLSPESAQSDFLYLKPYTPPMSQEQFLRLQIEQAMAEPRLTNALKFRQLDIIFFLLVSDLVFGKIHYIIHEEMESGAFVGNAAEDLGLNIRRLSARKFRLVSADKRQCLEVNSETGILFANKRIDREQLCGQKTACVLSFEIVVEVPLEMYRSQVEILDINDNSPSFPESAILLQMPESILPGSSFPLESALDPDVGTNTVTAYNISPNENFGLRVETAEDGSKIAELLLEKPLDRERQSSFQLMLTATDGGSPPRSGSARILITVLDSNDNAPAFDSKVYKVNLMENSPRGTLVVSVHAADPDEGSNAEITYSFSNRVSQKMQELFSLDRRTGEIRVQGRIDYEEASSYSLDVQAVDNGSPANAGRSKILINIIDVNDNAPEILLTSLSHVVPEDAAPGTVTALINVIDRDSGKSGQVNCDLSMIVPFELQTSSSGRYKLRTNDMLDRETNSIYNITILASDSGSPPLSTNKTIQISVSDTNDNTPRFTSPMDTVYVMENNAPGASIFAVTAFDPDLDQNSYITYSFTETRTQDLPLSNYLTLNSMNGTIYALRSFDYEQVKNFQIQVQARDAGVPPLSSSATLNVIILDQNDNAPVIVSPSAQSGSAAVKIVPQSAAQGYLVTKIIATDADSGQNARLHYQVLKATDPSLFSVGLNSGEIRTARGILDQDAITQTLVILVKDNGQPSLSSTFAINFSILGNVTENYSESRNLVTNLEYDSDINLYLIVILGSTSFIFLVTIILLIGIKCKQNRNTIEDYNSSSCCYRLDDSHNDFHPRPTLKESLNYTAAGDIVRMPETYHYAVCLSPDSAQSDFLYLKPCTPPVSQDKC
ncbi:LOW QUALITY PROTEIN: uncharacterized protein LOC144505608 [Mustelus asterias]